MIGFPGAVKAGATFRLPFNITDANDNAVDVSLWTIQAQLRDSAGALLQQFTVELENGGSGGRAVLVASAADTASWPAGHHHTDIVVTDTDGNTYVTATVSIPVEGRITSG